MALVELGAEVTNVSLHAGGMLVGLRSIPLGAKDVTDDIACAFGVQRREAERMKCRFGSAMTCPRDNHEMIEATPIGGDDSARAAAHHPCPAHHRHPPAHRADHERGRGGPEEPGLQRAGRAAGGADRRRRRAQEHRRLYAGRSWPGGSRRTAEDDHRPPRGAQRPGFLDPRRPRRCSRPPGPAISATSPWGRARSARRRRHVRPPDLGDEGRVLVRFRN